MSNVRRNGSPYVRPGRCPAGTPVGRPEGRPRVPCWVQNQIQIQIQSFSYVLLFSLITSPIKVKSVTRETAI